MGRIPIVFCFCLELILLSRPVYAEGYDDCRTGCDKAFARCQQQLAAFAALNAGLLAEKDAECRQEFETCHDACSRLEPQNEPEPPEEPGPEPTEPSSPPEM